MQRLTIIPAVMVGGALFGGSSNTMAQSFGMEYTTEWQTDFKGGYDWLNLLKTSAEIPLGPVFSFEVATISTSKTEERPLIDDLLTYSNIEAGNIPLTLSRMGVSVGFGGNELFLGINNVNEDYFLSDLTSFFTNSSCGISPTISCNYDIANYPLASWCVHYRRNWSQWSLQTSLYPGRGYYRLSGHDNLFQLDTNRDGIFSISSIDFKRNEFYTVLGIALYRGVCVGHEEGGDDEASAPEKKTFSATPWLLSELTLPCRLGLLAHVSLSTVDTGCRAYAGVGLIYLGERVEPGASFNYASFTDGFNEYDLELCARIPMLSRRAYAQPAIHLVGTSGSSLRCVGLLRLSLEI